MGQSFYYPSNEYDTKSQSIKRGEAHLALPSNWINKKQDTVHKLGAQGLVLKMKNKRSCILSRDSIFPLKTEPRLLVKTKLRSIIAIGNCLISSKTNCGLIPFDQALLLDDCHNKPRIIYGLQS